MKQFIENNIHNMKEDLKRLVKHNSINTDDALPFGKANREVLDEAISIMDREGLKTKNLDYYCAYGEVGEGEQLIGILAHLDIVPSGDGWKTNPFEMVEEDGILYGRGVSDDKGAAVAALYALKYLKESNYPFKKRVRLILGCNEETGSECIRHYVSKEGHIDMGFTPDGGFPGIFAEKGMVMGSISNHTSHIIRLEGGDAGNIVCKKVVCEVQVGTYDEGQLNEFFRDRNIEYNILKSDKTITLTVHGKAAHASTPDHGINAFQYLMEGLYRAGFKDEFVHYMHDKFALTLHGELLGLDRYTDEYSDFSINLGVVKKEGNRITCSFDMRFPVRLKVEEVLDQLESLNLGNNEFTVLSTHEPLFFDLSHPMIEAMRKAYDDVTGDKETPMACIGGGTYAKSINNCIAFGGSFEGRDYHMHDANENLPIEDFKKQVLIYIEALKNLNEVA